MRRRAALGWALLAPWGGTARAQTASIKIPAKVVPDVSVLPWKTATPASSGLDAQRIAAVPGRLRTEEPRVKTVVVVRDGQLIWEDYRTGFGPDDLHNVASVTKSVVSCLIGIAIGEGLIQGVGQKAISLLPPRLLPPADSRFNDVTVEHLLTMTAGFKRSRGFQVSAPFALHNPMAAAAGMVFEYESSGMHLLSVMLAHLSGMPTARYAERKLFGPLGITHYNWFADDDGYHYGSHELYLRPRDMARIGQLYLQKGVWGGRRLLDEQYAERSTSPRVKTLRPDAPDYGYLWWPTHSYRGAPAFAAAGFGGQFIFVVPSQSLVVAATSDVQDSGAGATFIREIVLPAFWK